MAFNFQLSAITFSGSQTVDLPPVGTVLIVGPNNSGKSRALREILSKLRLNEPRTEAVVAAVLEKREGSLEDFIAWLKQHFRVTTNLVAGAGFQVSTGNIDTLISNDWGRTSAFHAFALSLVSHLDTASRLSAADPSDSYDGIDGYPGTPLQILYADGEAEARLSLAFSEAFDDELVVDRHGANRIALRCGRRPDVTKFGASLSLEYAAEVRKLPLLHWQGDGMRSFVACLLQTEILQRPVALIDEPEAFLHPPQARRLAYHLARSAKEQARQVIIATHSADIVQGALESESPVTVVRLERAGAANNAWKLNSTNISELWKDPLLRVSNILDGLFHRAVVLCEADTDCRFYRSVLDTVCGVDGVRRPEVLFAYTGGKDRLAVAIRALRAVHVPVIAVADLDALSEEYPLRDIWTALGCDWSEVASDWKVVKSAVQQTARNPSVSFVKEELGALWDRTAGPLLDKSTADKIRAITRADGGWTSVKRSGIEAIPKGEARAASERLLLKLKNSGLHLVPVGELEGFVPDIGLHGPKWLEQALARDLKVAKGALDFVRGFGIT
jgi:predicted ATPase